MPTKKWSSSFCKFWVLLFLPSLIKILGFSCSEWQQHRLPPIGSTGNFIALDCSRRVNTFRTNGRAISYKRAVPYPFIRAEFVHALLLALIPVVKIITLRQCDRSWAGKPRLQSINRASRITQHAIDTHAVLFIVGKL